jgi:hypothetical protein
MALARHMELSLVPFVFICGHKNTRRNTRDGYPVRVVSHILLC